MEGLISEFYGILICLLCSLMRCQFDKGRYMPMLVLFSLFDVSGVV